MWSEKFIRCSRFAQYFTRGRYGGVCSLLGEKLLRLHNDWKWILGVIETLPEKREIYAAASYLISRGFWCEESNIDDELIERGYTLISKAWLLCKDQNAGSNSSTDDLLTVAINHEGGWIGEFWIHYASHLRQKAKEKWQGVPENVKRSNCTSNPGEQPIPLLMRELQLFLGVHTCFPGIKQFAIEYLFPLFNFDNDPFIAKQTWQVYLNYRRVGSS